MTEILALDKVTVRRDGRSVLRDVSLRVAVGERLAIVGPNGAGKTTLLRAAVGLEQATSGTVRLFGEDCPTEKSFRAGRRRLGFLFQDSDDQLFCPTVLEDVAFGPVNLGLSQPDAESRARDALFRLGIGHLADRITHRLSGGEKRLVCLSGLLAMQPDLILLDEPTNGVDAENMDRLRHALRDFPGAMILVSHDSEFVAEFADRALVLNDGSLADAEIHDHPHIHSHRHVHPLTS